MTMTRQTAYTQVNSVLSTANLKTIALAAVDFYVAMAQAGVAPVHPSFNALEATVRSLVSAGDDISG
jgi:hypothetical protein